MRGPIYARQEQKISSAPSSPRRSRPPRRRREAGVLPTHLGEAHGALLSLHVAPAGVGLRQLQDVVGPVLLRLALRQVDVSAREEEERWGREEGAAEPFWPRTHFTSSSLMSSKRLMLGNFSCSSFFRPLLTPTGTTFTLLRGEEEEEEVSSEGEEGEKRISRHTAPCLLVSEIQELRLGVVADEQTPLDVVEVDLRGRGGVKSRNEPRGGGPGAGPASPCGR